MLHSSQFFAPLLCWNNLHVPHTLQPQSDHRNMHAMHVIVLFPITCCHILLQMLTPMNFHSKINPCLTLNCDVYKQIKWNKLRAVERCAFALECLDWQLTVHCSTR